MNDHYLWIDLETTGLDPDRCGIIEIAAVLTTSDMEVLDTYQSFVLSDRHFEADAFAMHQANGLIAAYDNAKREHMLTRSGTPYVEFVEAQILKMLKAYYIKFPWIAGASVHFDRGFIARHMPLLDNALHYRHLDVSAITEMMTGLGYELPDTPTSKHRAMSDIRRSMALYRHWREIVGRRAP